MPQHERAEIGSGAFKCKQNGEQDPPDALFKLRTTHYRTISGGSKEHVPNNTYVEIKTPLRGSVDVCAWTTTNRSDVRVGVKFTADDALDTPITAPWQDAANPLGPRGQLTARDWEPDVMHWYQKAPKELGITKGIYLMIPRVFDVDCVISRYSEVLDDSADPLKQQLPDDCIAAEGKPFTFCVYDPSDNPDGHHRGEKCPPSRTYVPTEVPMGTATLIAGDTLSTGVGTVAPTSCELSRGPFHHWEGTIEGFIAPDTESDPSLPISGEFQLEGDVPCETISAGVGEVTGFSLDATGLDFEFLEGMGFTRAGPAATAEVFGLCDSGADSYLCTITIAATWVPKDVSIQDGGQVHLAEVTDGTFGVDFDGRVDTWED